MDGWRKACLESLLQSLRSANPTQPSVFPPLPIGTSEPVQRLAATPTLTSLRWAETFVSVRAASVGEGEGPATCFQPTNDSCRDNSLGLVFSPGAPVGVEGGEGGGWSNSWGCLIPEGAGGLMLHNSDGRNAALKGEALLFPTRANKSDGLRWRLLLWIYMKVNSMLNN